MISKKKGIKIILVLFLITLIVLSIKLIPISKVNSDGYVVETTYASFFALLISVFLFLIASEIITWVFSLGILFVHKKIKKETTKTNFDYFFVASLFIYVLLILFGMAIN